MQPTPHLGPDQRCLASTGWYHHLHYTQQHDSDTNDRHKHESGRLRVVDQCEALVQKQRGCHNKLQRSDVEQAIPPSCNRATVAMVVPLEGGVHLVAIVDPVDVENIVPAAARQVRTCDKQTTPAANTTHLLMRTMSFIASHVDKNKQDIAALTLKAKACSNHGGLSSGGMPSTMMAKPQLNISVSILLNSTVCVSQQQGASPDATTVRTSLVALINEPAQQQTRKHNEGSTQQHTTTRLVLNVWALWHKHKRQQSDH